MVPRRRAAAGWRRDGTHRAAGRMAGPAPDCGECGKRSGEGASTTAQRTCAAFSRSGVSSSACAKNPPTASSRWSSDFAAYKTGWYLVMS
ncbi:MAG: hypothetical protein JWP53_767 [Conexibacter sp.]|nr:hypothetical protein [Conexibacter sp.]